MNGFSQQALAATLIICSGGAVVAVDGDPSPAGTSLGEEQRMRWQAGVVITAPGAPCGGILGTVPVPTDWPEQDVRIVDEQIPPQVQVRYRVLENGVKQMLVSIRQLPASAKVSTLVTFEVKKRAILPPADPGTLVVPKSAPRNVRLFLGASPLIEIRNAKIRSLAREVIEGKEGAWNQVEAIYDWVRDNIEYTNGPIKGALAALNDGNGDCEELTSLFIALCRVNKIPARTVWVPGHCYPEFYLEDDQGNGHWFPCQAAGTREFGGITDFKPILQKGDNFKVPEKKEPQRYVAELLQIKSVRGGGQPGVQFIRELLPAE